MNLTITIPNIPDWYRQKHKKGFDDSVFGNVKTYKAEHEEELYWNWINYFIERINEIQQSNKRASEYFIEPD